MAVYTRQIAQANKAIGEKGGPAVLRQVTNSGTEWAPTQTETDTDIKALRTEEDDRDANGTLTGRVVEQFLIGTDSGVVPGKGDKIAFGVTVADSPADTAFSVVDFVKALSLNGEDILYTIKVIK